ncbi:MAG: single-stranded DNA-binding protein [Kiritimatiellia bacterium]|jgi:single-strand DNA-binding protein|nr:single-stranded DNA-binding protein [Kiritimatiellia bacterium]OQC56304.1 MAG: Single-stranded DNA-binding protein ssb [Verrucomicrobia bacterium ADurb.Bin018]MBP9571748.1 single-stranded DNA-binding protein [Kiritimatiellia bacterium]HOE00675.1 single-stranded DNA-binding protein [Kiritimatiellia bacterium]HQM23951.1 single-stranded DNA-binding protein [Kiritimatiellia bacterium]
MATLNKVMLIGNLTRDPELHRTPSGTAVTTLRLALDDSYTNKSGERVERAVFLDVDVWDRQAELCQQYLFKGSPVFVEGRLQMDSWDDKESGQKRTRLKVRAERVQFLGSRREGAGRDSGSVSDAPPAKAPPPPPEPPMDDESDIPF